jgi:ABC-type uncharacterized transport system substrate-binding protein
MLKDRIMQRRTLGFLVTLALVMLAVPLAAVAQPPTKVHRIGVLFAGPRSPEPTPPMQAFQQGLREHGYVEGQNLVIEWRWAEGSEARLHALAAELVQLQVDVLVPGGTRATLAAQRATRTIPIVMRDVAHALRVQLRVLEVQSREDVERAFTAIQHEGIGAFLILSETLLTEPCRSDIAAFALRHRLPTMYTAREDVEAGGLMTYRASLPDMYRRVAYYVDRILKGTKPADLPVEQPTKFELVINLKAAEALGITLPPTLLMQADEVIK